MASSVGQTGFARCVLLVVLLVLAPPWAEARPLLLLSAGTTKTVPAAATALSLVGCATRPRVGNASLLEAADRADALVCHLADGRCSSALALDELWRDDSASARGATERSSRPSSVAAPSTLSSGASVSASWTSSPSSIALRVLRHPLASTRDGLTFALGPPGLSASSGRGGSFVVTPRDVVGFALAAFAVALAAGGGIGGGGLLVPLYLTVFAFDARRAVALSNATILGGTLTNLAINVSRRHPLRDAPLIDWDLILVMEPSTMLGAVFGSLANRIFPPWLTASLLTALLAAMTRTLTGKAVAQRAKELAALRGAESIVEAPSGEDIAVAERVDEDAEADEAHARRLARAKDALRKSVELDEALSEEEAAIVQPLLAAAHLPDGEACPPNGHGRGRGNGLVNGAAASAASAAAVDGGAASSSTPGSSASTSTSPPPGLHGDAASSERRQHRSGRPRRSGRHHARSGRLHRSGADAAGNASLARRHVPRAAPLPRPQSLGDFLSVYRVDVPYRKVALLLALLATVVGLDLAKARATCGGLAYWALTLSFVPLVVVTLLVVRAHLLLKHARLAAHGVPYLEGDVVWTARTTITYPAICSLAGVCAGTFGIGGGIVKGPLMLEMGVLPDVAAATSATMILFTAASACVVYASLGQLPVRYAAALFFLGVVATAVGQGATAWLAQVLRSRAVIIWTMVAIMAISTAVLLVESYVYVAAAHAAGEIWKWGTLCAGPPK